MDFWFMQKDTRFLQYEEHAHGYWEVLLNLEGSGTMRIDGKNYPFGPGTIFCIRPGTKHAKYSEHGFSDGGLLIRDFCFGDTADQVLVFQDDAAGTFRTLYQLGVDASLDPGTSIYHERYLRSILDAIQNLLCRWKDANQFNDEVARIQKLLYDHVSDPDFDLNAAICSTRYSPNHFRTLFRSQCGCTPTQYFNQLKVQLAKQLLLQHKAVLSVTDIAKQCGFQDPFYFSRVFKQVTGVSPSQFCEQSKRLDAEHVATDMDPADYPYR